MPFSPLRAAIVAAVSTGVQATEDKYSIPDQLRDGRAECTTRHWPVVAEVVIPGHSRNYEWLDQLRADCPEYDQLIRLIDDRAIDVIVVRDYDRLWRTVSLQSQFMTRCKMSRVQVLSLNQPEEIVSPELLAERGTRLGPLIFSWLSEEENRIRAGRHKVGMHGRIRRGLYNGALAPYGYKRVATDAPLEIDEEQARWVRWMYQRRAEHWGYIKLFQRLNAMGVVAPGGGLWNDVTVARILSSDIYIGGVHWGSAHNREGGHQPIIDHDLWITVQGINRSRQARYRARGTVRALSGLAYCGACGRGLGYSKNNRGYTTLNCPRTKLYPDQCHFGAVGAPPVEAVVLEYVTAALSRPKEWLAAQRERTNSTEADARLAAIDRALAEQQRRYDRWNTLYEAEGISAEELLTHRRRIGDVIQALQDERAALEVKRRNIDASYNTLLSLTPMLKQLSTLPPKELHDIYVQLIERVIITKEPERTIEIVWR